MKKRTTRHIKWEDATELINNMERDNNRLYLYCKIQVLLGLRIGDILKLTWEDLFNKNLTIIEGKTKKTRNMIVTPDLQESAKREFSKIWKGDKKALVFLNKYGTGAISISYVNKALKKAFKKYNIEADQVSSHALRKTFCYKILEDNDFSEKAIFLISRLLKHSNINITMKYLLLDTREEVLAYESLTI